MPNLFVKIVVPVKLLQAINNFNFIISVLYIIFKILLDTLGPLHLHIYILQSAS